MIKSLIPSALVALVLCIFAGVSSAQSPPKDLPPQGGSGLKAAAPIQGASAAGATIGVPHYVDQGNYGFAGGNLWSDCCNGCERFTGLYAGIGFYYVQPFWETNPAFSTTTILSGGGNSVTTTLKRDFDTDFDFVPRVWIGYENCDGFGGRVSWWKYDQSAFARVTNSPIPTSGTTTFTSSAVMAGGITSTLTNTAPANQPDFFNITSDLVVDIWDFDVSQRVVANSCWDLLVGGGIRLAHWSQDYTATRAQQGLPTGTSNVSAHAASNVFNGAGPNLFIEVKRQLPSSSFAIYANARTGVLFGDAHRTSFTGTSVRTAPGAAPTTTLSTSSSSQDDLLPFLESELGVEWKGVSGGGIQPFVRVGVHGQSWFGVGYGNSSPTGGANGNAGFLGANFMVGGNY